MGRWRLSGPYGGASPTGGDGAVTVLWPCPCLPCQSPSHQTSCPHTQPPGTSVPPPWLLPLPGPPSPCEPFLILTLSWGSHIHLGFLLGLESAACALPLGPAGSCGLLKSQLCSVLEIPSVNFEPGHSEHGIMICRADGYLISVGCAVDDRRQAEAGAGTHLNKACRRTRAHGEHLSASHATVGATVRMALRGPEGPSRARRDHEGGRPGL